MPAQTEAVARAADLRSQVNEKLLKALITLLSLKDERLLPELAVIFKHAKEMHSEVGTAPKEVWARIDQQLIVISTLLAEEDPEEVEREAKDGKRH